MGDVTGFMKYQRQELIIESANTRVKHWKEFFQFISEKEIKEQGARCMDCGVPFCHWGCPLGNFIPEWNDLVYQGRWEEAAERLCATNNFPEITGRVCPALCEHSCVCSINQSAVTIKNIELMIIERAFENGLIKPLPPKSRTEKTVAVVGSGPAGLACADQLNKAGHTVTVYEKNEIAGGLLVLGIPDFKLEKWVIERRINLMRKEGVIFKTGVNIGVDIDVKDIQVEYDAVVLAGGAEQPRDLQVPGRELKGVYQSMHYLSQQNRINRGQRIEHKFRITAQDKRVIVLGGGDSGSDCVGTANRQGAISVKQFEILPRPPDERHPENPWPQWAFTFKASTSHEEGCDRDYCILTKSLTGEDGELRKLRAIRLEYGNKDPNTGRQSFKEILGSEFEVECDLVFLAMGFLGPVKKGMLEESGVELNERGNVKTKENDMTNIEGVFAAGDMRSGQSLVVRAIDEGRSVAENINKWLMI